MGEQVYTQRIPYHRLKGNKCIKRRLLQKHFVNYISALEGSPETHLKLIIPMKSWNQSVEFKTLGEKCCIRHPRPV